MPFHMLKSCAEADRSFRRKNARLSQPFPIDVQSASGNDHNRPFIPTISHTFGYDFFWKEFLVPVAHRRAYNSCHHHPDPLEPILELFRPSPNVRMRTLYCWRERFRTDPLWRPSRDHFSENWRVFSDAVEAKFTDFVWIHFLAQGRSLTRVTLQP
jgi:hypothetical protein